MKLIDLDQRVIVPVVDESRGGMRYEMQMSIGELLKNALEDFEPEVVEAIPVEWLQGLMTEYANINTPEHAVYAYCLNNVIDGWRKDQEEKRNG